MTIGLGPEPDASPGGGPGDGGGFGGDGGGLGANRLLLSAGGGLGDVESEAP